VWKGPAWLTMARDITSYALGAFLLLYEALWAKAVSTPVLVAATALMGLPGILGGTWLGRGGSEQSPPPALESEPPSPSSSSSH
jgi:hypothetical protein